MTFNIIDRCDRCGSSPTYYLGHSCSCFSFITQETTDNAKMAGVGDPILCDECLRLYMTKFGDPHLLKYLDE